MSFDGKDQRKGGYPPSNRSSNYYTDPVFTTDSFYGFEGEQEDTGKGRMVESTDIENRDAVDEPIESWGWINNVDSKRF